MLEVSELVLCNFAVLHCCVIKSFFLLECAEPAACTAHKLDVAANSMAASCLSYPSQRAVPGATVHPVVKYVHD
eukprot:5090150-Pleurochrysis_carterae.AAC.1